MQSYIIDFQLTIVQINHYLGSGFGPDIHHDWHVRNKNKWMQ